MKKEDGKCTSEHSFIDDKQEVMCQELVAKTLPLLLLQGYLKQKKKKNLINSCKGHKSLC